MSYECLHDREEIEEYLRRDAPLHLYALGDLDDFFWPFTNWYAWREECELQAVVLLYVGQPLPVVLALSSDPQPLVALLEAIHPLLPSHFYAHLSPGIQGVFETTHRLDSHGRHFKMVLRDGAQLTGLDSLHIVPLNPEDVAEINTFYDESYPGSWFDPRMLESGQYYGWREEGKLVCVGGIHVYSPRYRVAALGNIATHPDYRGRGIGTAVTSRVCESLAQTVDLIGLNVKADNTPALTCYRRLGFEVAAEYEEFMVDRR